MKRNGKWTAQDIQLEKSSLPIRLDELRKIFSWWKQYSFYSAIGVKEIMVNLLFTYPLFIHVLTAWLTRSAL
jgi:hypothetical protein